MSDPAVQLGESLKELSEELEESSEVKANVDSSAVIVLFDGSQHRVQHEDCQRFFASKETVRQFCDLVPRPDEATLELYDLTLPEEALFELEERLMTIEER